MIDYKAPPPAAWPFTGGRGPLGGQRVTDPRSGAGANVGAHL